MLKVIKLSKSYNGKSVFSGLDIDFDIKKTNIITGASGCGKTTLLRILTGLEKQDCGEAVGFSDKKISFVFQEDRLLKGLPPIKNISVIMERKFPVSKIKEHLLSVGLSEDDFNKPCSSFSGGMARRVAVVRAFMYESDIIILDEPLKGLDKKTKKAVTEYISVHLANRPLIAVTHDLDDFKDFNVKLINI